MPAFRSPSAMPFRSLDLRQATSGAARQPSLPRLPSRPSLTLPVPHYLALFHIIAHKWRFLPSPHFPRQPHTSLAPLSPHRHSLTLTHVVHPLVRQSRSSTSSSSSLMQYPPVSFHLSPPSFLPSRLPVLPSRVSLKIRPKRSPFTRSEVAPQLPRVHSWWLARLHRG